jgi:hypothetical protein
MVVSLALYRTLTMAEQRTVTATTTTEVWRQAKGTVLSNGAVRGYIEKTRIPEGGQRRDP